MTEDAGTEPKKPRRSHSFGGCGTCRRRHVKCDQVRPTCLTCRAVGVACAGYETELKWVSKQENTGSKNGEASSCASQPTRRHLYSEKSRMSMSNEVQSELASRSIHESLSELDSRFKTTPAGHTDLALGPFGVFNLKQPTPAITTPSRDFNQEYGALESTETPPPAATTPLTANSSDSFNNLEDFLDWPDLFELDFQPSVLDAGGTQLDQTTDPLPDILNDFERGVIPQLDNQVLLPNADAHHQPIQVDDLSQVVNVELGAVSPSDGQLLLKHFTDHVVAQMSSLPAGGKPPWEILHLRSAIVTLAKVTYMASSRVSHACMTVLLGMLAISAKHLAHHQSPGAVLNTEYWTHLSNDILQRARDHLRCSLKTETQGPHTAKYQDQVMALLTMLAFAVLYNHQQDARAYMIDAERLLRMRGLAKRKFSRKARLLHHLYTWVRIMGESSYVLRDFTNCELTSALGGYTKTSRKRRRETDDGTSISDPQKRHQPKLDDFLRLENDAETNGHKDRERGLHDIHLEDTREDPETMYFQLYGLNETFLSLVSLITRLGNVIDSTEANKKKRNLELLETLDRRKQSLENLVCSFAAKHNVDNNLPLPTNDNDSAKYKEAAQRCMVRALNAALVIFFYRRIRRVNPWILQEHVNTVVQALRDFDASLEKCQTDGPGSPWPCFMAGCEAMTKDQRDYFSDWLEQAQSKTGFTRFQTMLSCLREVWKRRDNPRRSKDRASKDVADSWIEVAKEQQIYLLLS